MRCNQGQQGRAEQGDGQQHGDAADDAQGEREQQRFEALAMFEGTGFM